MNQLPSMTLPWPIVWSGVELIAVSEGCRLTAYQCTAGIWTIGWGETLGGSGVKPGLKWTQEQADRAFCKRLTEFAGQVESLIKSYTTPLQLAAFVSLAYNIGVNAFAQSSTLRLHNQGKNEEAAAAIKLWNKAGGKVLAGLVTRRAKEAEMYLQGTPNQIIEESQPVVDDDCDKPLVKSASAQSGAAITLTGAAAATAEVINEIYPTVHTINIVLKWSATALIIVAIVLGSVVVYRAWKRRQEGLS